MNREIDNIEEYETSVQNRFEMGVTILACGVYAGAWIYVLFVW